jgi:hypothetical protein
VAEVEGTTQKPTKYGALAAAVSAAGFFVGGIENKDGCWDRMVIC